MDIKLARVEDAWDGGNERLQKEQIWQILFYGDILEKVQGIRPKFGYIYKTKSRKLSVNLHKSNDQYLAAIEEIWSYQNQETAVSMPALSSSKCKMCEWKNVCKDRIK
jgi:predicted RecB family nuclease